MTADVGTFPRLINLILERAKFPTQVVTSPPMKSKHWTFNCVYPDQDAILSRGMEVTTEVASKAPLAVYGCKKMIPYSQDQSTKDSLDYAPSGMHQILKSLKFSRQ